MTLEYVSHQVRSSAELYTSPRMDKRKATTLQWPWWKPAEVGRSEFTDAMLQVAVGLELLLVHGGS